MNTRTIAALTAGVLALGLTACGGDEADAEPAYDTPSDIADTLNGTDYECIEWSEWDEESGSCTMHGAGSHLIRTDDNPELYVSISFDDVLSSSKAFLVGDDWLFDCGTFESDQCDEVQSIIGGEKILPQ